MNRDSIKISYIAILGGLALLTSLSGLSRLFIYPPVPYLKFDPAEIFDMIAYLLGGLEIALLTSIIHFIGLSILGGDILGPGMKFIAIVSMIIGFHIGGMISDRFIVKLFISILVRVVATSVANIYVLTVLAPGFLEVFNIYNKLFFIDLSGIGLLLIALILTGVYNVIHNIFSIGVAETVFRQVKRSLISRL